MKVKYNKVFGYYLEVSNSYKDQVPDDYMRKQTLANAERYITPELKELEDTILGAEEKLINLEYQLFCRIRESISDNVARIQASAAVIAEIDMLSGLAYVSEHNNYVKPEIVRNGVINIKGGRHPVVEKMIVHNMFIENDTFYQKINKYIVKSPLLHASSPFSHTPLPYSCPFLHIYCTRHDINYL